LASRYKLTGPQLVCLRQLVAEGDCTPSVLAREVSLSPATVTGILDRLESRELVKRYRDNVDRRKVILKATDQGRKLAERAPLPLHESFARKLAGLPGQDQELIDQVLATVVLMMEADNIDAAPLITAGPLEADSDEVADFLANRPEAKSNT
jgi:DNA-binding MarR family transcriptional regulator